MRRGSLALLAVATLSAIACDDQHPGPAPRALGEARLAAVRERFHVLGASTEARLRRVEGIDGEARLEAAAGPRARTATDAPARTRLPARADGWIEVQEERSGLGVRFRLEDVAAVPSELSEGIAVYAGARAGVDLIARPQASGTEDWIHLERQPARQVLTYSVDVSAFAGLRLVAGVLELLDRHGTPRLRVARPTVIDASGARRPAELNVRGCAVDRSPAPPWDRPPTPTGATTCALDVAWGPVRYPAIVDPAWTTTGAPVEPRADHTATRLPSGRVLIAGGQLSPSTAEIYDPATGTFSPTAPLTTGRIRHTSTLLGSGDVLLAGGGDASAERFDPSKGSFVTVMSPMKTPRQAHTATLLATGQVLLTSGELGPGTSAELFNPTDESFTATANPMRLNGRVGPSASLLPSGDVLIVGGNSVLYQEHYEPSSDAFFSDQSSDARYDHAAAVLATGQVLLVGGMGFSPVTAARNTAEIFDPATKNFVRVGDMTHQRQGATATLLPNGRALVVGGKSVSDVYADTTEVYDPKTRTFEVGEPMAQRRVRHTATPLVSGQVLIVGGTSSPTTAELFELAPVGAGCATGPSCTSGLCDGGRCCAAACPGTCVGCAPGTGACVPLKGTDDLDSCTGAMTCDAAGACKKKLGQPCAVAGDCATGFCVEGLCCDSACDAGPCDRCSRPGREGRCGPADRYDRGADPPCQAYRCDGVSSACGTTCSTDSDCTPDHHCAQGSCVPRGALGAACAPSATCSAYFCTQCLSGHCVDGVCCDAACDQSCVACRAALKQAGVDGSCGPVRDDTNPKGSPCPTDPAFPCAANGKCDGNGGCRRYAPAGAPCGAGICQDDRLIAQACDGQGLCLATMSSTPCAPYRCEAAACTTTCATSAGCAAGAFCEAGRCRPQGENGEPCAANAQCTSGFCVDGRCCNGACTGVCEACDGTGTEGSCTPIAGPPRGGREACPAPSPANPCTNTTCDGTVGSRCAALVGAEVGCGDAACEAGAATRPGACDGQGGCRRPPPIACAPFACGPRECNTRCEVSDDCTPGATCDPATHRCVIGAVCDGDHVTTGSNGARTDCSPYRCASNGTCKEVCLSVEDCVPPSLCDRSGRCVSPTAKSDAGGCASGGRPPAARAGAEVLLALLLLVATAARRRAVVRPGQVPAPGGGRK